MTAGDPPPPELKPDFYRWSGHLADVLASLRHAFSDDLDQYLLYMIFVEAELARSLAAQSGATHTQPRGFNALGVALLTGLPRETVRRKLRALSEAGFLQLGPDGLHYLSGRHAVEAFVSHLRPLAHHDTRPLAEPVKAGPSRPRAP